MTDVVEKVELEFEYLSEMDQSDPKNILDLLRKNGDVGPEPDNYDLQRIQELRRLPKY